MDQEAEKNFYLTNTKISDSRLLFTNIEKRRLAVFAAYSHNETIPASTVYYLRELRKVVDGIIFVSDNYLEPEELDKIRDLLEYYHCMPHHEYDFGSWKIGLEEIFKYNLHHKIDELILCNDSCYGPISSLEELFAAMADKSCDFWGMLNSLEVREHIQSWFQVFRKDVIRHQAFIEFFRRVTRLGSGWEVVLNYETYLTTYLQEHGFNYDCVVDVRQLPDYKNKNITKYPLTIAEYPRLCPGSLLLSNTLYFIKKKNFSETFHYNMESMVKTINRIRKINPHLCHIILEEEERYRQLRIGNIPFIFVIQSQDYSTGLQDTLNAIRSQTLENYQVWVHLAGSSADALETFRNDWADELKSGMFRLLTCVDLQENSTTFAHAPLQYENHWLCEMEAGDRPAGHFLETFAFAIADNPDVNVFYASETDEDEPEMPVLIGTIVSHGALSAVHASRANGGLPLPSQWLPEYWPRLNPLRINQKLLRAGSANRHGNIRVAQNRHSATVIMFGAGSSFRLRNALESVNMQKGLGLIQLLLTGKELAATPDIQQILAISDYPLKYLPTASLAEAVQLATGDYVLFLDIADTWLHPRRVHNQVAWMLKHRQYPLSLAFGYLENGDDAPPHDKAKPAGNELEPPELLTYANYCGFSGVCAKRALVQACPDSLLLSPAPLLPLSLYARNFGPIGKYRRRQILFRTTPGNQPAGLSSLELCLNSIPHIAPSDRPWMTECVSGLLCKGRGHESRA